MPGMTDRYRVERRDGRDQIEAGAQHGIGAQGRNRWKW